MLLSAPERADGLWLFDGYRMTSFTDEEEEQTEAERLGLAWRLDVALKNAGAVFDDGPSAWISHVVVDRNLITGQNPRNRPRRPLRRSSGNYASRPARPHEPRARSLRRGVPAHDQHAQRRPCRPSWDAFARHDVNAVLTLADPRCR